MSNFTKTEQWVCALAAYGTEHNLIDKRDTIFVTNQLLAVLQEETPEADALCMEAPSPLPPLSEILKALTDIAVEKGLIQSSVTERDLFDTKLMGILTPLPSAVEKRFYRLYENDKKKATDDYYSFSKHTNYIREDRIKKDKKWTCMSDYGLLDITINLSKPEKDPKAIAKAGKVKPSSYPKCMLCPQNEGYHGRINFPARENHRIIEIDMLGRKWGLQYSPYVYYNEHCIVFNTEHVPMKIDHSVFDKLLSFVSAFPHYFVGSNADLPIVGGSILSHEHFQGGRYTFAMEKAPVIRPFEMSAFPDVSAGIVHWPVSVIRLQSKNKKSLSSCASYILDQWRGYSDEEAHILSHTGETPHNTITPIARMRDGEYELDLALRNNRTTPQHPLGLFHPHEEKHHIKKENIGLIEVMGLAVLPARLDQELAGLADYLLSKTDTLPSSLSHHFPWIEEVKARHTDLSEDTVMPVLLQEVGAVFCSVLEDAGVFKTTKQGLEQFCRFTSSLSQRASVFTV